MTPALEAVSAGDLAWWSGDRRGAVAAWHRALDAADAAPEGRAAEVMARVRLMRREGNLAPLWHEGRMDRALADCPRTAPWCRIAEADTLLFLPTFAGGDPSRVAEVLRDCPLTGPASARRVLAGAPVETLTGELDGMGQGIRRAGRQPADPGTWTLGVGVGGAVGSGVGFVVRWVDPDVAGRAHRLDAQLALTTRGAGYASAAFTANTALPVQLSGLVAHTVSDRYEDTRVTTDAWWTERGAVGVAPRVGRTTLQVGGAARSDDGLFCAGPYAAVTLGGDNRVRLALEAGTGDYDHLDVRFDARGLLPLGPVTVAAHVVAAAIPTADTPWTRLPYAGGEDLLRGLPAGRFRDAQLLGAQLEVRHRVVGPLEADLFVDAAAIEGVHWTAGGGLRLVLPPERDNVTRVELGAGPEGWGVVVAWGNAF